MVLVLCVVLKHSAFGVARVVYQVWVLQALSLGTVLVYRGARKDKVAPAVSSSERLVVSPRYQPGPLGVTKDFIASSLLGTKSG